MKFNLKYIDETFIIKMSYIIDINCIFDGNNRHLNMKSKKITLFPKYRRMLEKMGENIKLARKRRSYTAIDVASRANIHRETLSKIENGDPSVSMGAYYNLLRVLRLEDDIINIAKNDDFGKKLQDLKLL